MTYKVVLRDEARRAFLRLDKAVQAQVQRTVDRLADGSRSFYADRDAAPNPCRAESVSSDSAKAQVAEGSGQAGRPRANGPRSAAA